MRAENAIDNEADALIFSRTITTFSTGGASLSIRKALRRSIYGISSPRTAMTLRPLLRARLEWSNSTFLRHRGERGDELIVADLHQKALDDGEG